jgi:hypothetical protein
MHCAEEDQLNNWEWGACTIPGVGKLKQKSRNFIRILARRPRYWGKLFGIYQQSG